MTDKKEKKTTRPRPTTSAERYKDRSINISGNVAGANINTGDHVKQTIKNQNTEPDNRSLEVLLNVLAEKIQNIENEFSRNAAQQGLNAISEQSSKPQAKRDKTTLENALSFIQNVTNAVSEIQAIKQKLLG
ncbi:hypothetical protein [Candidatus Albibeggiatoa sp. nov. NOAA]|uniref:hypothetical protein n=1 Tax=Candidatus Albibeggiatoa sp. nov. NOAA TaxID=3162724 RepID=UPI003304F05E|nr:hypothetical protein [Thiotrichaceae bacterium]